MVENDKKVNVAPYMGAWIETQGGSVDGWKATGSLPIWERGLKLEIGKKIGKAIWVAPYMGAWIETKAFFTKVEPPTVSLPIWERGLKPRPYLLKDGRVSSLPIWERGLKQPF